MFSQILIAMDMSALGREVFEQGLSLAQKYGARLRLIHVLSAEEENSPLPIPDDLKEIFPAQGNDLTLEAWRQEWHDFEAAGEAVLQSRCQIARRAGLEADWQQVAGSPGKTICKVAQQWPADLIAIGHRGRSGLSELLMGSVSNYVLHHAPCSVLAICHRDGAQKSDLA
jgi:nucleotide-binding universal stress UspA family protein